MTTAQTLTTTPAPDLNAIKARQREMWASGDYAAAGAKTVLIAEQLCDAAHLRAGSRVVDVATGSGNAALAAARCGCEVTGIDYVPALLARGRARAEAEGLEVTFVEGDAKALPLRDASADAVVSVLGVMFAPDQERAAGELLRVSRPGGTIALASCTPDGFTGELSRTIAAHVPAPAGLRPLSSRPPTSKRSEPGSRASPHEAFRSCRLGRSAGEPAIAQAGAGAGAG